MIESSTLQALIGGVLIGISASVLIVLSGKIAGISGILTGAVFNRNDRLWRILFILGLLGGGLLAHKLTGKPFPELAIQAPWAAIAGGLIVGYGVRMGSGCTSGHGVCGIARLSKRSLVATLTFIGFGIATVAATRIIQGFI